MAGKIWLFGSLFLLLFLQLPQCTDTQDIDIAEVLQGMPLEDKAKFIADFLYTHPETFLQLEDILVAAMPILRFDTPPGWLMNAVLPWALDNLPYLLKNDEFLGIVKIFITELNAHNAQPDWMLPSGTKTERRNYFVKRLFSVLDYSGMLQQIQGLNVSVRYFFPYASTTRPLNEQCYNDTMSVFERVLVGETWAFDNNGSSTLVVSSFLLLILPLIAYFNAL